MSSSLTSVLADPGRLAAVRQTNLLDSPAEDAFDRVARMAARLLEVPIALVPLIEHDRQFFKACVGLPEPWASARQTPLSHSLCQHVLVARQPLAIGDTGRDALAHDNPLVRELGLAAYLGVPLIDGSGHALGSVCVADRRPRDWTPEQVAILTDLAGLVMTQIQLRAELATRGELERRLIDVEASLQALLERLPSVVYALSPQAPNSVVYVSPQIQALLGVSAADCIGDPEVWDRLVHPEDAEWVAAECERTNRTGEPFSGEYRMRTAAGQVRWVRDEAVLVRAGDGRPLFWQGILTDITATHLTTDHLAAALDREQQAAQQLGAALERERAAAEHLRAVDEMKTTFLQAVSHDLRTPLTTILGIAVTLEHRAAGRYDSGPAQARRPPVSGGRLPLIDPRPARDTGGWWRPPGSCGIDSPTLTPHGGPTSTPRGTSPACPAAYHRRCLAPRRRQPIMAIGTVKWFDPNRGYGFIRPEQGEDVFVHISAVQASGLQTLQDGQTVEFDLQPGRKGPQATNLRPRPASASG